MKPAAGSSAAAFQPLSGTQLSGSTEFAVWLEGTPPALFLQESGWLYAGVNTAHVLGIALLVGAIVVLDLRLLGAWRRVPVAMLGPPAVAVASAGLGIALVTGPLLLIVQASEYVANPFLYIKFGAILVGLVNLAALRLAGDWNEIASAAARRAGSFAALAGQR